MSWAAATGGHCGDIVRDVMLAAVEHRFGGTLKAYHEHQLNQNNMDRTRTLIFALLPALIAACTTVGKPYPFPHDGEPSAELEVRGNDVYLLTLNQKGCYTGKTHVEGGRGAQPVSVVPDVPLVISYEENVCLLPATFTPKKDARYRLIAVEGPRRPDSDESFFTTLWHVHERQCAVGVAELDAEGKPLEPVKLTELRPRQKGVACIKFIDVKRRDRSRR